MGHGNAGTQSTNGIRGRVRGKRSVLFVPEQLNMGKAGAKEPRWGALACL